MRYSRAGIVAVLLAAEVFLGGAILWCIGGTHGWSVQAAGLHRVDEHGRTLAPVDAGNSPHVAIDDPDSKVVITPSTDGKVHVTDAWAGGGWSFGTPQVHALSVRRTADGVSITREGGAFHVVFFGWDSERTEVALPPGSYVDVQRSSGAQISGLSGRVRVHSVDGRIEASDIRAQEFVVASDDGRIVLDNVTAPSIDASTSDGRIYATNLSVDGGRLQTNDGSVYLGLQNSNLTVHARTNDGSIHLNGERIRRNDDSDGAEYRFGTGGGLLEVSTQDGSIHISTNGAAQQS